MIITVGEKNNFIRKSVRNNVQHKTQIFIKGIFGVGKVQVRPWSWNKMLITEKLQA